MSSYSPMVSFEIRWDDSGNWIVGNDDNGRFEVAASSEALDAKTNRPGSRTIVLYPHKKVIQAPLNGGLAKAVVIAKKLATK